MYTVLTEVLRAEYPSHKVFSDIGCYTLGANAPFNAIDSCVDMGASITMAKAPRMPESILRLPLSATPPSPTPA